MNHPTLHLLALSYVPQLGIMGLNQLLKHFDSPEQIWHLSKKELAQIKGLRKNAVENIGNSTILDLAQKEIDFSRKNNIQITTCYDTNYPLLLKECNDAPPFIFTKGNLDLNSGKFIAIVGTRKMTSRGKEFVQQLVEALKDLPISIISGLALGVDVEAHKAAIKNNLPTIAVLAHSVKEIYPKTNEKVGKQMLGNGGLLSEHSSFHKPEPENFLRRNRIIAGLCHATIIVETAIKGGAMNTARCANMYNRDVFAVPGRTTDALNEGCHYLIKNHQAFLLTEAKDVLAYLNLTPSKKKKNQTELFIQLSPEEEVIFYYLKDTGKRHIDQITADLNLPVYQIMPILLNLEFKNLVSPIPGKYYELI